MTCRAGLTPPRPPSTTPVLPGEPRPLGRGRPGTQRKNCRRHNGGFAAHDAGSRIAPRDARHFRDDRNKSGARTDVRAPLDLQLMLPCSAAAGGKGASWRSQAPLGPPAISSRYGRRMQSFSQLASGRNQAAAFTGSPLSTRSPSRTPIFTVSPSLIRPARICSASGSCTCRWITRFRGRAPYAGS